MECPNPSFQPCLISIWGLFGNETGCFQPCAKTTEDKQVTFTVFFHPRAPDLEKNRLRIRAEGDTRLPAWAL